MILIINSHIGKVSSKAFRSLYIIQQTKKFVSTETTKIWCILSSYHTSITVSHCSMVFHSSNMTVSKGFSMQRRVVCLVPKFDHITPVMRRLHWRPVRYRVMFKILLLLHKFCRSVQPALSDSLDSLLVFRTTFKIRGDRALPKRDPPRGMSLRAA